MEINLLLTGIIVFLLVVMLYERVMNRKRESELLNRLMSKNFAEYSLIVNNEKNNSRPLESSVSSVEREK